MAKSALIITHHIYLTKEQRYLISQPDTMVEVTGISSPVFVEQGKWLTKTAHEVFCNYKIAFSAKPEKNTIRMQKDGYLVTLTGNMPSYLLDVKDGGSMCLMLTHRNFIKKGEKSTTVIHCLSIEDMDVLLKTMVK